MIRTFAKSAFMFLLVVGVGCGQTAVPNVGAVDVSGTVKGPNGKPLKDLILNFQPTGGNAQQSAFPIKPDGTFTGKMNAGKYTYFISADGRKNEAGFKTLPAGWKEGSLDRQVDVAGGKIELTF